jgi:gustatory receptor
VLFLVYTSYKCVVVIYISWRTRTDSQKTGIQLHKIANVVDESHFYNVCNHLSLKLLNHSLNFTACGFFDLDMTTLYGIGGAITSYLIILIQFNLAAIRAKSGNATVASNGPTVATTAIPVLNTFSP